MDIHLNSDLNLEEVARMHQADLKVQHKYGVIYQRYWVNEEMGTVFCLMEGPDKESCEAVHREAHGDMGCNIIEVQPGDYQHYLGQFDHHVKDRAFVDQTKPDTGLRIFVHLDLICGSDNYYFRTLRKVQHHADNFKGSIIEDAGAGVQCTFISCLAAIEFALALQNEVEITNSQINGNGWPAVELCIGISAGDPVDEHHQQLFAGSLSLAKRLCDITKPGQVMISNLVRDCLIKESAGDSYLQVVKVVDFPEQKFLVRLMKITDEHLGLRDFNVQSLGRHIGLSRPQFYRKMINLTGLSPKEFIREQRLKNAVRLLRKKFGNISEIALQVGYQNPSYFSKCFQHRFGSLPSKM